MAPTTKVLNAYTEIERIKDRLLQWQAEIGNHEDVDDDFKFSKADCKIKIKALEKLSLSNEETYAIISPNNGEANAEAFKVEYRQLSSKIEKLLGYFQERLEEFETEASSLNETKHQPQQHNMAIKLARIELPTFHGTYESWPSFRDLFETNIHFNNSMSDANKMAYLKSYVKGEAASLIANLTTTNASYEDAWGLIHKRYENHRLIATSYLNNLFNVQSIKQPSPTAIKSIFDSTNQALRGLERVVPDLAQQRHTILFHLTFDKLDSDTRRQWQLYYQDTTPPTYDQLCKFLENYVHSVPQSTSTKSLASSPFHERKATVHFTSKQVVTRSQSSTCPLCMDTHQIYHCEQFKMMPSEERFKFIEKQSLCFNCLTRKVSSNHNATSCPGKTCKHCGGKHSTLLHAYHKHPHTQQPASPRSAHPSTSTSHKKSINICSNINECLQTEVLLSTAVVNVPISNGSAVKARAFLDSGAKAELVSEEFVQRHKLKRRFDDTILTGVGGKSEKCRGVVQLTLQSRFSNYSITIEAYVLKEVTGFTPQYPCSNNYPHLTGLDLADPDYHIPSRIDILVGNKFTFEVLQDGKIAGQDRMSPIAVNTQFGWVLGGTIGIKNMNSKKVQINTVSVNTSASETNNILQKYFELEEIQSQTQLTVEEKKCEEHFTNTVTRDNDGRFCVKLPFNGKQDSLGSSRDMAVRQWKSVERRLAKNKAWASEYFKFMTGYISLGHMEKVPRRGGSYDSMGKYYLPHHFVVKPDSTTTKFRVVFNASQKTSSGVSLNDCLLVGATIQSDIFTLLVRFRQHKYALKADIAKMFRQFRVCDDDCDYQRIVWRETPSHELEEFKLLTVTYGTGSAPFLATRCLVELCEQNMNKFPITAQKMKDDTYVDDFISGTDTIENAEKLISELNVISASAMLSFRKWSSNNLEIMTTIPEEFRECKEQTVFDKDSNLKALGVQWNSNSDSFSFTRTDCNLSPLTLTKRTVLSQLARVFDPLGLLSPVTINAKLFMQQLWKNELGWDERLTEDLFEKWREYQVQLKDIELVNIPRYVKNNINEQIELHGFCDASEKAYGAVVYVRQLINNSVFSVHMLASKSRVASTKTVSLPRLELNGALLLSELLQTVQAGLGNECDTFTWTDSMIVLQWLASHPRRWQTYVANRVSKIQEIISFESWNHVRSADNPADLISRGISASGLSTNHLWWNGPSWLSTTNHPEKVVTSKYEVTKLHEARKTDIHACHISIEDTPWQKFSSFNRMRRVFALMKRLAYNFKNKNSKRHGPLQPEELQSALVSIVKVEPKVAFGSDIQELKDEHRLPSKSKLLSLNPFLDDNDLLRVGGRIQNATANDNEKHPIILPHNSHFTKLLIQNAHYHLGHGGNKLVWCYLRQQYWIVNARNIIKAIIRQCVKCRRYNKQKMTQLMGNLPSARTNISFTFLETGVDYAGPFHLRPMVGRQTRGNNKEYKGYFCIFVCMATKAVHIEPVSDLTTEGFIAALRRFTSRRGVVKTLHSDCGTNFIGADNELKRLIKNDDHNQRVTDALSTCGIKWEFITPSSPHHGGLWEAAVKSTKKHLVHVMGEPKLTFEQFTTVLCQVEAILNSRPLTPMTMDPDDINVLTPGHFLIGRPITSIPTSNLTEVPTNKLSKWRLTEQMIQHFWQRWKREYLTTLQQRWKWKTNNRNIRVGDLCVLNDDNQPPSKWKLARVSETFPGLDGFVFTVMIKTIDGSFKRPITKLNPLLFVEEQ